MTCPCWPLNDLRDVFRVRGGRRGHRPGHLKGGRSWSGCRWWICFRSSSSWAVERLAGAPALFDPLSRRHRHPGGLVMTVEPPIVWLLLVHAATTLFMVGVIWFVQIVHYPLFFRVGEAAFSEYERDHARRTGWVVAIPMILELATAIATVWVIGGALAWSGLNLLAVVWVSTAIWQVPAHRRLERGFDAVTQRRLLKTNWVRTVAWSARGVVACLLFVAHR